MFGIDDMAIATGLGAVANLGGGFFSSAGQAAANADNVRMQNMYNQQTLNAQQASHAQNTAFMEDSQAHGITTQVMAQDFNATEAQRNRDWQLAMVEKQNAFQTNMANTAYQRAMADMKKAGLNPILAYMKGGATSMPGGAAGGAQASSSPGGGGMASAAGAPGLRSATVQNEREALGRAMGNMVSSAVDTAKTAAGVDVLKQEEKLKREQVTTEKDRQKNLQMDSAKKIEETFRTNAEIDNVKANNALIRANAASAAQTSRVRGSEADNMNRYGTKDAPNTLERILRTLQGHIESLPPPTIEVKPKEW